MVEQFDRALRLANTRIIEAVGNFLPGALVFLVVLALALAIALVLRSTVRRGLNSLDFDRRAELLGMSLASWTPSHSASTLIASIVYWTVLMLGLLLGLTALDAALPSQFAVSVLEYVPHLLAAIAIVVGGGIVARYLARAILIGAVNMGMQHARLLSLTVKWLVLIVAAAMALDHVGIAVKELAQAVAFYRDALGLTVEAPEEVPSQRVRAHFIPAGGAALELLEATSGDSPIAGYLERRGPGLHHITLRVDDIAAAMARLKARGVRLIDEQPRPGAHGSLVAFIHPASAHGVLVELKQKV